MPPRPESRSRGKRLVEVAILGTVALAACAPRKPARDPRPEQEAYVALVLAEAGAAEGGLEAALGARESPFASVRDRAELAVARLDPAGAGRPVPLEPDPLDVRRQEILDEGRWVLSAAGADARALRRSLAEKLAEQLPGERDERARWAIAWVLSQLAPEEPAAIGALSMAARYPNLVAAAFALEGLSKGKPPSGEVVRGVRSLVGDEARFWIVREAACRTLERWLDRGELPADESEPARAALHAHGPLLPAFELGLPGHGGGPRRPSDPELLRRLVFKSLRNPRAVVTVAGRGEFLIEIHALEAPLHAFDFASRALRGDWSGRRIERVDPLSGVLFTSGDPGSPLAAEPSPREILRGAVLSPLEIGGGFFIAHLPLPAHYGKTCPWGRVALGMEVVDTLRAGDVIESIRLLDPVGRPITRSE